MFWGTGWGGGGSGATGVGFGGVVIRDDDQLLIAEAFLWLVRGSFGGSHIEDQNYERIPLQRFTKAVEIHSCYEVRRVPLRVMCEIR